MYDKLITSDQLTQVVQKIEQVRETDKTELQQSNSTLSSRLDNEAAIRQNADNVNSTAIATEVTNRTTADSNLQSQIDNRYTKSEVDSLISTVYKPKGSVSDYSALLAIQNPNIGDVYNLLSDGSNYVYTESGWDGLSGIVNVDAKADKSETVTNVNYANKKLTKTIDGTTSDIVSVSTIKSDLNLSKYDVGLGNVDNTRDKNKPISDATQKALDDINKQLSGNVTFAGLEIAQGPLHYYKNWDPLEEIVFEEKYIIESTYAKDNIGDSAAFGITHQYRWNFVDAGKLFSVLRGSFNIYSGNIDDYRTIDGWRLPTKDELIAILGDGFSDIPTRAGSTVNNQVNKHTALIAVTDDTAYPYGYLVFPDGETITGTTINDFDNGGLNQLTRAQVQEYLDQGCVFFNAVDNSASILGDYLTSTSYNNSSNYTFTVYNGIKGYNVVNKTTNSLVRLVRESVKNQLDNKVDKVVGKQLSTEDYTTSEKTKLSGIESGAEVNVQSDWNQTDITKDDYIKNKPTTLSGYGITDAKIESGTITLGNNTITPLTQHQDISGKADKVTSAINNNFAALDANGNLKDSGHKHSDYQLAGSYKTTQTAVQDPSVDGTGITFIDSITQNTNGVITPHKKTVQNVSDSANGLMTSEEHVKLTGIEENAQVNTIEHIKINGSEQTISNKTVNLPAYPTSLPASDVYSWAKASTKPSYNFSEIGGTVADSQLPDTISSDITGTAMGLKTEKLTDQEFVYRATPNTIKAKSLSLDRIYGKTFVWNQLVQNGNFTSTSGWQTYLSNFTVSNNTATVVNNSARGCIYRDITVVAGHKYFCSASAKSDGTNLFRVRCESAAISNFLNVTSSSFVYGSVIVTAGSNSTYIRIAAGNPDVAATGYVRDIILIDLTIMFGAGNEPSTVEEFESLFPESYYDYNAGTLISNEAKEIESVGFNLWDEEWEQGGCDLNGVNITDASRIRSKNHIPVIASMSYYMYCSTPSNYAGGTMQYNIYYYDLNKNFLSAAGVYNNTIITIPSNAYFVRFTTAGTNRPASASYHNDICINLSDTNKNGTYEPYKKYTHKINLDSFKVTDGTNVYTINGLKSAGNVYDEIVGEKYIKRVGEVDLGTIEWNAGSSGIFISYVAGMGFVYQIGGLVCSKYRPANTLYVQSWSKDKMVGVTNSQASPHLTVKDSSYSSSTAAQFKAAMSGVMLYYELATPETYELVTPLVTSMRAGTTESRISPNADSLSAPFCADMTYSVADYTEYADRAGALVKGASVDLTDITASGELSGNAFKVIAEHIAKLTARVEVLEAGVGTVDTLSSTSVDSANGYYINGDKTVIIGSGAPTMVPAFAGQFYINTSGPALYYAVNNSATTDWKQA